MPAVPYVVGAALDEPSSSRTAVSVDVAYVWIQPMIAVDVAVLDVVSVSAPLPPSKVTSPVRVVAPVTASVPPVEMFAEMVVEPCTMMAPNRSTTAPETPRENQLAFFVKLP